MYLKKVVLIFKNVKYIQLILLLIVLQPKVYADNTTNQQLPSKVVSTYEASIGARKQWLLSIMKPDTIDKGSPKFKTYDILGITALQGCGPKEYSEYMVKIAFIKLICLLCHRWFVIYINLVNASLPSKKRV